MSDHAAELRRLRMQLRAELNRLRSEHTRLKEMLERCKTQADTLSDLLEGTSVNLEASQSDKTEYTRGQAGPGPSSPFEARSVEIFRHVEGWAQVRIDDCPPFRLPRGSVEFLVQIASGPAAADGLPQWKSRLSLRVWLEAQHVRDVPAKLVNHRVHTLRKQLRAAGVKKHLVHTDPRLGIRFALRDPQSGLLRRVLGAG